VHFGFVGLNFGEYFTLIAGSATRGHEYKLLVNTQIFFTDIVEKTLKIVL